MNLVSRKWSLTFASTLAAALLAACGGGSEPAAPASTAQAPAVLSGQLMADVQAPAASGDIASTPEDTDRKARGAKAGNNVYIVQLDDLPATAYDGRIKGLGATKPKKGQKIDPDSPAVASYVAHLSAKHDKLLQGVGNARKLYSYGYVFNGFAAELSDAQAAKLAMTKGVLAVGKDELRSVDTSSTPNFLGLAGASGFWNTTGARGENVVIGIVDSGITPESESFTDRTGTNGNASKDGKLDYKNMPHWKGKCINGDQFNNSDCNQKLIAARYYNAGWGGNAGVAAKFPHEYNSPRDYGGHGTHTASTAGGNSGVTVTGPAAPFGTISGIAPRARISVYKVCWSVEPEGGCFSSDSVAAIEQAVADGVDVINFSISGSSTNFRDPVEIAFLFAADAGIFVAASAGNSGPASSTVAHPGPWLTTVAAGTHNRSALGSVTLGNAVTYSGSSLAASAAGPAPLINATDAALPGASASAAALCFSTSWNGTPVLDPAKVAGKIVVCDRGTNDRVNKSLAVKEAGGIGMVLVNVVAGTLNADYHAVPTVHLADTARTAVKAYAASSGATATVNASTLDFSTPAPFTASFSSRGPLIAGGGSLLKPDLIAPGQDILAAVAPPGNSGRSFDIYSGTSMSSPHVAGLGALFKQLYPSWSPMAIKSALMTTGTNVLDGGTPAPDTNPVLIFRQGAGHVKPMAAVNPGLVFDSGYADWLGFLCGTQLPASFCTSSGIPVLNPSDMNGASIAMGAVPGVQTVTRRVTNVGGSAATYTLSYTGMAGYTVTAPASLQVAAGETKSFSISFKRTTAPLGAYVGGQLRLTDGVHNVRIPMVARAVAMAAPAEVGGSYNVTFGYDGAFSATPRGLVPASKAAGSVATNGAVDFQVVVPAGMTQVRFSTFDSDISQASDLDMEVYGPTGALVGSSGGATAQEEVNLFNPAAGTYTVRVIGFAVPSGSASFNLYSWLLGSTSAGNMTVTAPATAVTGQTGAIGIATSGLAGGTKYMGSIVYGGTTNLPAPTVVRIDTP